ncbi:MAG: phosphate ABC transporter permease PstA [Phycisphaerales bacterium]|jgi:phosphate transport system permease protein
MVEPRPRTARAAHGGGTLLSAGEPVVWLMAAGLGLALAMIAGLLAMILWNGGATFWPRALVEVSTSDGRVHLGEVSRHERYRPTPEIYARLDPEVRDRAEHDAAAHEGTLGRTLLRTANYDLTGTHFTWIDDFEIEEGGRSEPEWGVTIERLEWGRFYGTPTRAVEQGRTVAEGTEDTWAWFEEVHPRLRSLWRQKRSLETHDVGRVNHELESARLELREAELREGVPPEWIGAWGELQRARQGGSAEEIADAEARVDRIENAGFVPTQAFREAVAEFESREAAGRERFAEIVGEVESLSQRMDGFEVVMRTADGTEAPLEVADIVRAIPQNRLGIVGRLGVYLSRWIEFLVDDPREANSEGGVFPAIFGTVAMTLIMTIAVVPFGVLAALYLREYAKAGPMISAVRIAVNNLAGVPSIVFGVFGLGFFCYVVGASIDELLFEAKLPNPTYGKGGLLWASLTLALLTLPVVIVATEEALAAVPRSMREGSYACGASKWQTIRRIVLPRAMPGIMTGAILAMARGAGEVAPLMLVGAVKLAPELAVDATAPYVHPDRSFMHLGFHIYDLGFQSQNSEAAKPMVFTTTLLLIILIMLLNVIAVWLRTRLRRRFAGSQF